MGIIRYSCGFLYCAFVFCYLAFLRGDVLAEIQFVLSKGLTHYSVIIGAFIITFTLQIVQWVVSKIIHGPDKFYFLTYVPSFIGLAMLIGMDQNMDGKYVWGIWNWLLPILIATYILIIFVVKRLNGDEIFEETDTIQARLWPNFMMIFFMICACGFVSNTPDVYQYEMKTERMLVQKDYAAASQVGKDALGANERLTQLRMYALSKQGLLGENIFTYPQNYGTKGLLNIHDTVSARRFPMTNIEFYLGGFAGKSIKSNLRYLEILAFEDTLHATEQSRQYLLCYYLLAKNLEAFDKTLHRVYGDTIRTEIPRAYQEAVVMQHDFVYDSIPLYINKVYVERYQQYDSLKNSLKDPIERKNKTRREFGDTFWWYYEN